MNSLSSLFLSFSSFCLPSNSSFSSSWFLSIQSNVSCTEFSIFSFTQSGSTTSYSMSSQSSDMLLQKLAYFTHSQEEEDPSKVGVEQRETVGSESLTKRASAET